MKYIKLTKVFEQDLFFCLMKIRPPHFYVRSKTTLSCIERLSPSCADRGVLRWHVNCLTPSHTTIDFADGFPRNYFIPASFIAELESWLAIRYDVMKEIYIPINFLSLGDLECIDSYGKYVTHYSELIKINTSLLTHLIN